MIHTEVVPSTMRTLKHQSRDFFQTNFVSRAFVNFRESCSSKVVPLSTFAKARLPTPITTIQFTDLFGGGGDGDEGDGEDDDGEDGDGGDLDTIVMDGDKTGDGGDSKKKIEKLF